MNFTFRLLLSFIGNICFKRFFYLFVSIAPIHFVVVATPVLANESNKWFSPCFDGHMFRFSSGFEGSSKVVPSADGKQSALEGSDNSVDACYGKSGAKLPKGFRLGAATIQYESGSTDERLAQVIRDPDNATNHVLQFWLQRPNVEGNRFQPAKGRVQMAVHGNIGVRQINMTTRMYLSSEFNLVRSFPGTIDWLTVSEWWNNPSWIPGEKFPFRISVNLIKESSGTNAPLYFSARAQTLDAVSNRWNGEVWSAVNREFVVPIGRWVKLEYGFVEGDANNGRFFLAATVQGGRRTLIFDKKGYTHHPNDNNPDGLTDFNPMKLYTSSRVIDYVRSEGGSLQVFWDDFNLVACHIVESSPDSACSF